MTKNVRTQCFDVHHFLWKSVDMVQMVLMVERLHVPTIVAMLQICKRWGCFT